MKTLINWVLSRSGVEADEASSNFGLLVFRLGLGLLIAFGHGWGKLMSFTETATQFPDPFGVGGTISLGLTVFAEVFCGVAIALGLLTRLSAIPLIIMMLVAVFVIHGDDPFGKKEFALLYLLPFVTLMFTGPGRFSLDWILFGEKGEREEEE